jgi:hypothetical protein
LDIEFNIREHLGNFIVRDGIVCLGINFEDREQSCTKHYLLG